MVLLVVFLLWYFFKLLSQGSRSWCLWRASMLDCRSCHVNSIELKWSSPFLPDGHIYCLRLLLFTKPVLLTSFDRFKLIKPVVGCCKSPQRRLSKLNRSCYLQFVYQSTKRRQTNSFSLQWSLSPPCRLFCSATISISCFWFKDLRLETWRGFDPGGPVRTREKPVRQTEDKHSLSWDQGGFNRGILQTQWTHGHSVYPGNHWAKHQMRFSQFIY